jgi:hypothetical protein
MIWWDSLIDLKWPNLQYEAAVFMTVALLIPPFFFFLYGFNVTNSLLRKKEKIERQETRHRLLKKTIIFFIIAEFSEGTAGLVVSPEHLLNYLLTWELFHLFSLSTLVLLLVFEFAWYIEVTLRWNHKQVTTIILSLFLVFVLAIFLIFHDYSDEVGTRGIYVNLDLNSFFQRIVFEDGQNPVIPWISFPIVGGLLASFLDLPHEQRNTLLKKVGKVLFLGTCFLIIGVLLLDQEGFRSPPVLYPASSSFVLITIGGIILITMIMILFIDLPSRQTVIKVFSPIVLISNISLTVFIVHNAAFIIPSDSPFIRALIPSITAVMIVGALYCVFFIIIARLWKKWNFKYSVEWMIWKLQRVQWGWWVQ